MLKIAVLVLKIIVTILVVFSVPFIIPLFLKLLLNWGAFENLEQLKEIIGIFNNKYTLIYICIGGGLILFYFHKWDGAKGTLIEFLKGLKASYSHEGKTISFEIAKEEMNNFKEHKEFMNELIEDSKAQDSRNLIQEMQQKLGIVGTETDKNKCIDCNKSEIQEENIKLRNFATFNMLNKEARELLHIIYCEKYISINQFRSRIIQGYKKRNKRNVKITKKDIDKIAKNKYNTIYDGLKFLNIIEPSEDDETIKLTQEGRKFVEKYIEKKEVV